LKVEAGSVLVVVAPAAFLSRPLLLQDRELQVLTLQARPYLLHTHLPFKNYLQLTAGAAPVSLAAAVFVLVFRCGGSTMGTTLKSVNKGYS